IGPPAGCRRRCPKRAGRADTPGGQRSWVEARCWPARPGWKAAGHRLGFAKTELRRMTGVLRPEVVDEPAPGAKPAGAPWIKHRPTPPNVRRKFREGAGRPDRRHLGKSPIHSK